MKNIPIVPCHIGELNISCFGCCGNKFFSKEEIYEDIRLNTEELLVLGSELDSEKLKVFRDRFDGDNVLSLSGLCYNVVDFGSGCFGCPLHPRVDGIVPRDSLFKIDNTQDLRVGHCDINEECATFTAWKTMSDEEKLKFVSWVEEKGYDSYSYSKENGEEMLFEKFLKR